MKLTQNEKGMTLIELVVVMIISVILMGIAGSILVSSTGIFTKTAITDQDKLATDKIKEFVEGEILYATDVIVSNEALNTKNLSDSKNWHYFLIKEGRLYRDSETVTTFSDSYYGNKFLILGAKAYDNYRLDLTYDFVNIESESEYRTTATIVLPNVRLQYENGDYDATWFKGKSYTSSLDDSKKVYIYYDRNSLYESSASDSIHSDGGTVADQMSCKIENNPTNVKGEWKSGNSYTIGDFVYLCAKNSGKECQKEDQIWYRYLGGSYGGDFRPDSTGGNNPWKCITKEYKTGSKYYRGDVVLINDNQYSMYFGSKPFFGNAASSSAVPGQINSLWAPVTLDPDISSYCAVGDDGGDARYNTAFIKGTHAEKLLKWGIKRDDLIKSNAYSSTKTYESVLAKFNQNKITLDDIVRLGNHYYLNISGESLKGIAPDTQINNKKVWFRIDSDFGANNIYYAGDVVILYYWGGSAGLFRATSDITDDKDPIQSEKWERIYYNLDTKNYQLGNQNN